MLPYTALSSLTKSKELFHLLLGRLQPDLILDVGSRDGRDALRFRAVAPDARIVAFEANPLLARAMAEDTQLAEAAIHVRHCAVSASNGSAPFYVFNRERGTGSLLPRIGTNGTDSVEHMVPICRLDDTPEWASAARIALWIDVEGCAYEVLEGARQLLPRVVLIHAEVEAQRYWTQQRLADDVLSFLGTAGFSPIYQRTKRGKAQANVILVNRALSRRPRFAAEVLRFELGIGLKRLVNHRDQSAPHPAPARRSAPSPVSPSPLPMLVATLWWVSFHLPRVFFKYYGTLAVKRLQFSLFLRRSYEPTLEAGIAPQMVRDYRAEHIAVAPRYLDADALRVLDEMLEQSGCREAVRRRKREAGGDPRRDYFHLSQEPLSAVARERLFGEILPHDFHAMLELARGRRLRCLSVTYHETDADDPTVQRGDSVYNAHPFHIDGNPKFAKALLYLTDVDDAAGPFEMVRGSRFPLGDELVRLAYQEKHFRKRPRSFPARCRRHVAAFFRRDTQQWDDDAAAFQKRFPGALQRVVAPRGSLIVFDGLNLHNGSRNQTARREVLHFIFI